MPATPLKPPSTTALEDERLKRLNWLGYLLDNSIRIPGTELRFGYDAVIGLVPGVGDLVGLALSAYIVVTAARYRLPASTLLRMVLNLGLEALVGMVPLLGDVFDAAYKANAKNLGLLHDHLRSRGEGGAEPSNLRFFSVLLVVTVFFVGLVGLALFAAIRAFQAVFGG
jgi:hypothetical protein